MILGVKNNENPAPPAASEVPKASDEAPKSEYHVNFFRIIDFFRIIQKNLKL